MSQIRSFYSHYGVLSISLITMTIFCQFGLRPSQTEHKRLAYVLDIWFICSYSILFLGTIGQLSVQFIVSQQDIQEIQNLFNVSYTIIATFTFTMWLFMTFKKYNLFCLLEDIVDVRSTRLGKGDIFCLAVTMGVIGTLLITINYAMVALLQSIPNSPIFSMFMLIYANISFTIIWNITLLLCTIVAIISREFQECIDELEIELNKHNSLNTDVLSQNMERFKQLISIVNKIDSIFSVAVGIILTLTLSTLCGAIYAMVTGINLGIFYSAAASCAATLGLLLLWLPSLNHTVRNKARFPSSSQFMFLHPDPRSVFIGFYK